ncbi:MAG: hypothetical protein KGO96_05215 [Elusimicrobia bacterium]|nr:hypothetical protein [Elusimicrobiota bacterium]MDE2425290.1 hypothetical protein [Elusimicrobiota bacterium]
MTWKNMLQSAGLSALAALLSAAPLAAQPFIQPPTLNCKYEIVTATRHFKGQLYDNDLRESARFKDMKEGFAFELERKDRKLILTIAAGSSRTRDSHLLTVNPQPVGEVDTPGMLLHRFLPDTVELSLVLPKNSGGPSGVATMRCVLY